jgi:hypothetical protein
MGMRFSHPLRVFPGTVSAVPASASGSVLLFKKLDGDKGLRNAARFFWLASGIRWTVIGGVSLAKVRDVVVATTNGGLPYTYDVHPFTYSKYGMMMQGSEEFAAEKYFSTDTARWTPPQRPRRMLGCYEGSGADWLKEHGGSPVLTPWRGKSDSRSFDREESLAHPGYFRGGWISLNAYSFQIVTVDGSYGLDCSITGALGCYAPVDYPGIDPPGQFELLEGEIEFVVSQTEDANPAIQTRLSMPLDLFEPCYLNGFFIPGGQYQRACVEGNVALYLNVTFFDCLTGKTNGSDVVSKESPTACFNVGVAGSPGNGAKGGSESGGLRTGGLKIGGLKIGGLKIGGLKMSGSHTGSLRTGKARTVGLKIGGLKIGGLKNVGLQSSKGFKNVVLQTSTGFKNVSLQSSQGLKSGGLRSGGLRSGGLKTGTLAH